MSAVIEVTDTTFEAEVLGAPLPVLVDYWADWCAPCQQLSPIIEELANQYAGRVVIAYDSDGAGQAATKRAINLFAELSVSVGVAASAFKRIIYLQIFYAVIFVIILKNENKIC